MVWPEQKLSRRESASVLIWGDQPPPGMAAVWGRTQGDRRTNQTAAVCSYKTSEGTPLTLAKVQGAYRFLVVLSGEGWWR